MTPYRLPRKEAASYIGVSPRTLDALPIEPCRDKLAQGSKIFYLRKDLEKHCDKSKEALHV